LRELKIAIKRDLEWLLKYPANHRACTRFGARNRAFGLPVRVADISSKSLLSSRDHNDLVREMESAIAVFEPRLKRAKVRMERVEGGFRALRFVIEGLLCMDPAPEPVRFDTVLELGKGEYEIKGEDSAR